MSSPAYDSLIRELARDPRELTYKDMALVIREFPEIPAEAIAERHAEVAETLEQPSGVLPYLGLRLATCLLSTCKAYIETDVTAMRAQIDIEDVEDDVYNRRVV